MITKGSLIIVSLWLFLFHNNAFGQDFNNPKPADSLLVGKWENDKSTITFLENKTFKIVNSGILVARGEWKVVDAEIWLSNVSTQHFNEETKIELVARMLSSSNLEIKLDDLILNYKRASKR